MAWTAPATWTATLVTVAQFNEQIRDNMLALKSPPSDNYESNEGADYTSTSTAYADVDTTDFTLSITTTGGDVVVGFHGLVNLGSAAANSVHFDVTMDGTQIGGDDGITADVFINTSGATDTKSMSFTRLVTGVSAGAHTFVLRWKSSTGGSGRTLYAGAGTSNRDVHPQFWCREVS